MIKQRIIATITGLAVAAMIVAPVPASALTAAELQAQINTLLDQLSVLQDQLADMTGDSSGGGTVTGCTITSFDRNLKVGESGADVKCLQIVLNSDSDTQLSAGVGSPGQETSYFGPKTKSAVIKFQEKYANEVLAVYGLTSGTGYVGTTTRAKLNELLASGTSDDDTGDDTGDDDTGDDDTGDDDTGDDTTASPGSLTVAVASDTPSAATVPANATAAAYNVPAIKLDLTANGGPVEVTALKILRSGISEDAAVDNIKIFDEDGNQIGNSQSIGSNHKANFSNISIEVPANTTETITVKVSMTKSDSYDGNVLAFGVESADDIASDATSVAGNFALKGNNLTLTSSVTIGTATLDNGSLGTRNTTNLTVDPNDKDIRFTQVKIVAGSAEGLTVKQLTAVKNGTVASSDVTNIRLVNDGTGETLATVDSLNSDGRAVFNDLNISVAKGGYVELSVIADMNDSGSGRTVAFDLHDGTAYTIEVIGNTYSYGLTPARSDFCTSAGTCQTQTINQGYLTVQKSSATPATGYIAIGASQVEIAAFDFNVYGESVNITSTQVLIDPTTASAEDFTNITGYDDDGNILFGPKDGSTTAASTDETLTFTDAYTLPIGTNTVHIKANVSSSIEAEETVDFEIPASSVTAKGASSGKTTYTTSSGDTVPPTAARTGNTQTVQGPSLTVVTAGTPAASNVVRNAQDYTFAYFDLDTSTSGEDVKVTQIVTLDTSDGSAANTSYEDDIINLELWGDPDTTDGVDEFVKLETTTSTATQASTAITTFTFKTPLKIKKGTVARLTLKADVTASADAQPHQFLIDGSTATVTSTGWSTGTAITEGYNGTGQAQTVTTSGTLKIVAAADTPAKAQFVAGTDGNEMMTYEMYASNENVAITRLYVAAGGGGVSADAAVRAAVNRVKVYFEGDQVGADGGYALNETGYATVELAAGEIVIPKDTWTTLSIKVDFNAKDQITDNTTLAIGLGDNTGDDSVWASQDGSAIAGSYGMIATGVDSGTTLTATNIDSLGTGAGNIIASYNHKVYKGILVVSKNSSSPSGSQTAGAGKEVLRLDLQAIGDRITINEMEFCVTGSATAVTGTGSVTLKDVSESTTYATLTQSGYDSFWDVIAGAGTYYPMDPVADGSSCFSFGDQYPTGGTYATMNGKNVEPFTTTIEIAEDTTKTVKLFGDTTGAASTKTLQVELKKNPSGSLNATTSGIEWQNTASNDVDETITDNTPITGGALEY